MPYQKQELTHCKNPSCGLPFSEDNPRAMYAPNRYRGVCTRCWREYRRDQRQKQYEKDKERGIVTTSKRNESDRKKRLAEVTGKYPRVMQFVVNEWEGK